LYTDVAAVDDNYGTSLLSKVHPVTRHTVVNQIKNDPDMCIQP